MSNSEKLVDGTFRESVRAHAFTASFADPGQLAAIQPPADYTGLIPAKDWCAANGITGTKAAVIEDLQNRKAALDLDYILSVGELVLDAQRELQGKLYEQCLKEVLGVSPRSGTRYSQIYLLKQQVPELSQASVDALSIRALETIQSSLRSYELSEEQKRLIIEEAERRAREQEKLLTERTIGDLKVTLKEQAVDEARNALQDLLDDQTAQISTQKTKITTLINQVEEMRAKMGTSATAAEVAHATIAKPVEGSVTDRATPSLSMLKSDDGKKPLSEAQVYEVTRWLAEKRREIELDIKQFDEIYSLILRESQKRSRSFNLFWEGVDLVWKDLPGVTAWKEAYGQSGDRAKALKAFAIKVTEFGQKLIALDKMTHYREGEFRVVD